MKSKAEIDLIRDVFLTDVDAAIDYIIGEKPVEDYVYELIKHEEGRL